MRTLSIPIAFMLAATATAQRSNDQRNAIAYTEFTLDNGLHVILHQDRSTPIVCVSVMYHVGSKNEDPTRRGFAHFFEHLLFEGSANIGRGEFSKHVEKAGGVLNANTTADRTYYYEVLPSNQLELGLWLESERMLHAKVDQKGVDTQREVVKEERRQRYENQPYGTILLEVLDRAYDKHPYKWPTIGFMEDLNAASEADYQAFYKKFYVPNNAVLVVAGDIDPENAKALVRKYFAEIPRGAQVVQPDVKDPGLTSEVRAVIHDRIQLPAVVLGYRIPATGAPDYYAVDLVNRLLSNGNSSRLNKSLKDEQQKAVGTGAFSLPFEQGGLAILYAIANMGVEAQALEEAMTNEVRRIQQDGVPKAEFDKLMAQLETELVNDRSRIAGIASDLARCHMLLGDTKLVNTEIDRYLALTPDDLKRAAQNYFTPQARVVLHYLPAGQKQQ
ncbi:MAG TPA: pitrilysin family protein [Flavobacteriales bacterium]|nr:pitrilysin family protein [Flavobacteriales bacterium]